MTTISGLIPTYISSDFLISNGKKLSPSIPSLRHASSSSSQTIASQGKSVLPREFLRLVFTGFVSEWAREKSDDFDYNWRAHSDLHFVVPTWL